MSDIQNFSLDAEQMDNISGKDMDRLEEKVEKFIQLVEDFEDDVDSVLEEINDSEIYKELGVEVNVSIEHSINYSERDGN